MLSNENSAVVGFSWKQLLSFTDSSKIFTNYRRLGNFFLQKVMAIVSYPNLDPDFEHEKDTRELTCQKESYARGTKSSRKLGK